MQQSTLLYTNQGNNLAALLSEQLAARLRCSGISLLSNLTEEQTAEAGRAFAAYLTHIVLANTGLTQVPFTSNISPQCEVDFEVLGSSLLTVTVTKRMSYTLGVQHVTAYTLFIENAEGPLLSVRLDDQSEECARLSAALDLRRGYAPQQPISPPVDDNTNPFTLNPHLPQPTPPTAFTRSLWKPVGSMQPTPFDNDDDIILTVFHAGPIVTMVSARADTAAIPYIEGMDADRHLILIETNQSFVFIGLAFDPRMINPDSILKTIRDEFAIPKRVIDRSLSEIEKMLAGHGYEVDGFKGDELGLCRLASEMIGKALDPNQQVIRVLRRISPTCL